MKKWIYAFSFLLVTMTAYGQQVLYVVGDGTGTDAAPELYVEGGDLGFIYVQGGVTVSGTTPKIINEGAIVVGEDNGTGGDWINNSGTALDISSPTATYTDITGVTDLGSTNTADDLFGGTVHMVGAMQNIAGTQATIFYNLSLDGTGNTEKTLTTSVAGDDMEITKQLMLNDEYLHTGDNVVFVSNTAVGSISRASAGSTGSEPTAVVGGTAAGMGTTSQNSTATAGMVTSTGNGRLKRAVGAGMGPYLLPIGTADKSLYRPAEIMSAASATNYLARVEASTPNATSFGTPEPYSVSTVFYHLINADAGATGDELRLYFLEADVNAPMSTCNTTELLPNLGAAQSSAAGYSAWTYEPATGTAGTGDLLYVTTDAYATNAADYQSTIGDMREAYVIAVKPVLDLVDVCPLPIELIEFTVNAVHNQYIQLDWSTAIEDNVRGFEVQRSIDGERFDAIDFVQAIGQSTSVQKYTLEDRTALPNIEYYYRLRVVDMDDSETFTHIETASLSKEGIGADVHIFPNPVNEQINITFTVDTPQKSSIEVYDNLGRLMSKEQLNLVAGTTSWSRSVSHLASGIYHVRLFVNGTYQIKELVVKHP